MSELKFEKQFKVYLITLLVPICYLVIKVIY